MACTLAFRLVPWLTVIENPTGLPAEDLKCKRCPRPS